MPYTRTLKAAALSALIAASLATATLAPMSAVADDDTDFICYDLDNGDVECEDIESMAIQCKGNMDVYPCSDVEWAPAAGIISFGTAPNSNMAQFVTPGRR